MTYQEAVAALDALYAALPAFTCQGHCQESCGVIMMSRIEWLRITRHLGYKPKGKPSLVCPMLKHGRCSVHPIRPLVCRLYGLMDEARMHCPWGCQPSRWLTEEEGYALLERAEAITQAVFPQSAAVRAWSCALRPPGAASHLKHLLREARMPQGVDE